MGKVITFYSYKGGVGRSMAVANVAVVLVEAGYRVLVVDWDLEAPGIEHYFLAAERFSGRPGIADLLDAKNSGTRDGETKLDWTDCVTPVALPGLSKELHVMPAGRRDEEYFSKVRRFDIDAFYIDRHGGEYIERLRDEWKAAYDFVLVDSRTGVTDTAGICTAQLPDLLVAVFTPTSQALYGVIDVVNRARIARSLLPVDRPVVPTLPLLSRVDVSEEFELSAMWLDKCGDALPEICADWLPSGISVRTLLELVKVPYRAYFSYGEHLPVIEQGTLDPTGIGYAYQGVAALVAAGLDRVDTFCNDRTAYVRSALETQHERVRVNVSPTVCGAGLRKRLEDEAFRRGISFSALVGFLYSYAVRNRSLFESALQRPSTPPGDRIGAVVSADVHKALTEWAADRGITRSRLCAYILEKVLEDEM